MKILSDQTGGKINSLVNLTTVGASPHTVRRGRLSSNASPVPLNVLTESIQSINKLADSVENLREKLTSHPGIFFPMTKKEQVLEELLLESLGKDGQQMPTPNVSPNSVALNEQQPRCGFICIQRSAKRLVLGCEKFVPALAYLVCCLGPA